MAAYEPHIDGLRGIAITAVLFFHCGFASAGHGFLGVDVFFVISGYLITGLLLREAQQTGPISLRHFYLRRARRLLPNLFALLLVTGLAAPLFMNHEEVAQLGKSLIATTVYLSNVFFYRQSGYFSPAAEELPLLHTWSLAVEEQFYFVWPAIILGCCALWRGRDNFRMLFVVAAIGAASAIFFAILDTPDPDASFYFSPARVWQFAAGALLAIARPLPAVGRIADRQSVARKIAVGCAVVVLGYVVTFGARTEHDTIVGPLAVVAATVTLLAMCRAHGQGIVARALQSTFANFLGKTSYSVYLWHWPVIVFYRFGNPGAENNFDRFFCLFLSIGVGVAAYYLVEAPIRRGQKLPFLDSPKHALVFFGSSSTLLLAVGLLHWQIGPTTYSQKSEAWYTSAVNDINPLRKTCLVKNGTDVIGPLPHCGANVVQTGKRNVVVWGDSHADALFPGIRAVISNNISLVEMTKSGCPPLSGMTIRLHGRLVSECTRFNESALRQITFLAKDHPVVVVLVARWALYMLGDPQIFEGENNDQHDLSQALRATLNNLSNISVSLIVVGPVPEYRFDVPRCLARATHFSRTRALCSQTLGDAALRIGPSVAYLKSAIGDSPRTFLYRPDVFLCRTGMCKVQGEQQEVLFFDEDHLTTRGARLVATDLIANKDLQQMFEAGP